MLGIITEVTLQCIDAFNLEEKLVKHTLDYCLENLDSLAHSAEYVKIWAEVYSQSCHVYSQHKTTKETNYVPCFVKEFIMVGCIVCDRVATATMIMLHCSLWFLGSRCGTVPVVYVSIQLYHTYPCAGIDGVWAYIP